MSKFSVGEIAIIAGPSAHGVYDYTGKEVEILSEPYIDEYQDYGYEVDIDGDRNWFVPEYQLKKKKPPHDYWQDVEKVTGWNPTKVTQDA